MARSYIEQKLLSALENGPMTVSEIRETVYQRHRKVQEINDLLAQLEDEGLVYKGARGEDDAWFFGPEPQAKPGADKPPVSNLSESHEYVGDNTWKIDIKKTTIRTVDELIERCKIDTNVWTVKRCRITKWEMGAIPRTVGCSGDWRRPSTEPIVTELFAVSAELEKKVHLVNARHEIELLREEAKQLVIPAPAILARSLSETGNMLEISLPDLHLAKLAWSKETGWADYDTNIAQELGQEAFAQLIVRSGHYRFDEIVIPLGNDYINADNRNNTTTRGTPQDSDSRFHKTFVIGRKLAVEQINYARSIANKVRVVIVPGNHDEESAWHLGDSLEMLYEGMGAKDVIIDNSPRIRKYYQWGCNMFLWTHSHKGKRADYPLIMATEQPRIWSETVYRECHTGHRHQSDLIEKMGVRVRTLPTLCATDEWHAGEGYIGNIRSAEAYNWNKLLGLMGISIYTVPDQGPLQLAA